jgi:hypothetical protein
MKDYVVEWLMDDIVELRIAHLWWMMISFYDKLVNVNGADLLLD